MDVYGCTIWEYSAKKQYQKDSLYNSTLRSISLAPHYEKDHK